MSISNLLQPNNFPIQGSGGSGPGSITGGFTADPNVTLLSSIVVQTGKIVSATIAYQLVNTPPASPGQMKIGQLTGVGFPPFSASSVCVPATNPQNRGTTTVSNAGGVFIGDGATPYVVGEFLTSTFTYAVL